MSDGLFGSGLKGSNAVVCRSGVIFQDNILMYTKGTSTEHIAVAKSEGSLGYRSCSHPREFQPMSTGG